jgi:hypothetical protein
VPVFFLSGFAGAGADFDMNWRKKVTAEIVRYPLRELWGDDVSWQRRNLTRWAGVKLPWLIPSVFSTPFFVEIHSSRRQG